MEDTALILEAKRELTNQLTNILVPFLYKGLQTIWTGSKNGTSSFKTFQEKLSLVPKWNQDIINSEFVRIVTEHETCDEVCLSKLIEAVFISNVKILSTVKINKRNKKLNIEVPSSKHFIHKCYVECARMFYTKPQLFDDRLSNAEVQKNVSLVFDHINLGIQNTIRKMLPIKHILQEALQEDSESEKGTSEQSNISEKNDSDSESDIGFQVKKLNLGNIRNSAILDVVGGDKIETVENDNKKELSDTESIKLYFGKQTETISDKGGSETEPETISEKGGSEPERFQIERETGSESESKPERFQIERETGSESDPKPINSFFSDEESDPKLERFQIERESEPKPINSFFSDAESEEE